MRRGFTLLEILLVLALIGFMTGVLVVGGSRLLADRPETPVDIFWEAVQQSREYALLHNTEVRLSFDAEAQAFNAMTAEGQQSFPVPPTAAEGDLRIEFLSTQKFAGSILIGGTLLETATLPEVTFYGDGTCTSFRVQLRTGTSGAPTTLTIDPWTCAEVLAAGEAR